MTKRELHIGVRSIDDFGRGFVDKWKEAEGGEARETTIEGVCFKDAVALLKALTGKRLELLRELHRHPGITTYELARRLGRHQTNVHHDIVQLKAMGLICEDNGLTAPYTKIHAEIDLTA